LLELQLGAWLLKESSCVELCVAEKIRKRSVKRIGAGFSNDVDVAPDFVLLGLEQIRLNLEFPYPLPPMAVR
jgi:hypothetical protein